MAIVRFEHHISVCLAGEVFESRSAVLNKAAEILSRYDCGEMLRGNDFEFACDLIKHNRRAPFLIGCGIRDVQVSQPPYKGMGKPPGKRFRIHRLDDTISLCGYHDCVLGKRSSLGDFRSAAEEAVKTQLEAFAERMFKSPKSQIWCPKEKSWITWRTHSVVYYPEGFEELVDRYVALRKLHLGSIRYTPAQHGRDKILLFADVDDRREWQNWHRKHARLRIVKKSRWLQEVGRW